MQAPVAKSRDIYCIPLQRWHEPLCVGGKGKLGGKWIYRPEKLQDYATGESQKELDKMVQDPSFFKTDSLPDEVIVLDKADSLYLRLRAMYPGIAAAETGGGGSNSQKLELKVCGRQTTTVKNILPFLKAFKPEIRIQPKKPFFCRNRKDYVYAVVTEVETCNSLVLSMESRVIRVAKGGASLADGGNANAMATLQGESIEVCLYKANPDKTADTAQMAFRFKALKVEFSEDGKLKIPRVIDTDNAARDDETGVVDVQKQHEAKFIEENGDDFDIEFEKDRLGHVF